MAKERGIKVGAHPEAIINDDSSSFVENPKLPERNVGPKYRRNSPPKTLIEVWFQWHCNFNDPPVQNGKPYHDAKMIVAYMRLFLPEGYDITGKDDKSKTRILSLGKNTA